MWDRTIILQVLWTSFASASFQVLFTIAFALVLKVTKIWNFTQPALMATAFYAMYVGVNWLKWPMAAAIALSLVVTGALAWAIERFAFTALRARKSESIGFFIFTLVFAQFVIYVLTLAFTTEPLFMLPSMFSPVTLVGDVVVSEWDVRAILVAAAMVAAIWIFFRFTRQGQFMIAVSDNADLAEVYGIDKGQIFVLSMLIAAVFIVVAMYLFGTKLAVFPELTLHILIFAVAATILGGIDRIFAPAAAAVAINILQQLSVLVLDSRWQPLIVFGILFIAILFFPRGIRLPRRRIADAGREAAAAALAKSVKPAA